MSQFAFIYRDDEWFVAQSVEGIASQGKTQEEAIENLKEALELFYEDNDPLFEGECTVTSFLLPNFNYKNDKIRV